MPTVVHHMLAFLFQKTAKSGPVFITACAGRHKEDTVVGDETKHYLFNVSNTIWMSNRGKIFKPKFLE